MNEEQIGCGVSLREAMPLGKETPLEVIKQLGEDGLSGGLGDVCYYASFDCNLNCYMCLVRHMKGRKIPKMSMEQIKEGFKDAKVLFHLGGEPWVNKDMMEIVEYFDSQDVNQIMSTNGTQVSKEVVEKLAKLKNFVNIQVSLNAPDDLDGKIRGVPKAYEKSIEAIRMLVDAGLSTWIHCTIVNENVDILADMVKIGAELGVGAVNFIFGHVITEEQIESSKTLMKKWIGEDVEINGAVVDISYSEEQLINSINAAKEEGKNSGVQVMFFSKLFGDHPEIYWRGTLREQEQPICQLTLMPPMTPNIGPDGSVYNCPYIVKSFGNINEMPLKEIWDSEQIRAFRRGMINDKLLPICTRCPCSDIVDVSDKKEHDLLNINKWTDYIERLTKEFNELPDVKPLLANVEPTVFQYNLNDHPELNFWHAFDKNGIRGGMGENVENKDYIQLIHRADFDVVRKIFSGEQNPVQATMAGLYKVDGDMAKLMACAPFLPLQVVAHEKVINK
ncbi:MAG: radical SAM protein [Candidatus Thorarchaeota archaeon]